MSIKVETKHTNMESGIGRVYGNGATVALAKSDSINLLNELSRYGYGFPEKWELTTEIVDGKQALVGRFPAKQPNTTMLMNHWLIIHDKNVRKVIKPIDFDYESPCERFVDRNGAKWILFISNRKKLGYLNKDLREIWEEELIEDSKTVDKPNQEIISEEDRLDHESVQQDFVDIFWHEGVPVYRSPNYPVPHEGRVYKPDVMMELGDRKVILEYCNKGSFDKDISSTKAYFAEIINVRVYIVFAEAQTMRKALPSYENDPDLKKRMDRDELHVILRKHLSSARKRLKENHTEDKMLQKRAIFFDRQNWRY